MIKPAKGTLLISEPFMRDPTFLRTVILLVEKNKLGTVGFVLNQKLKMSVSEVLENTAMVNVLFNGGPVARDTLHFLFRGEHPVKDAMPVIPGLYWGGDFNELIEKVNAGNISPQDIRFFVGYSGWEPGQLEAELEDNTWVVAEADVKTVFGMEEQKLWKNSMKSLGGEYALLANSPIDPKLN